MVSLLGPTEGAAVRGTAVKAIALPESSDTQHAELASYRTLTYHSDPVQSRPRHGHALINDSSGHKLHFRSCVRVEVDVLGCPS